LVTEFLRPLEETLEAYGISEIIVAIGLLLVLIFRPQGVFGSQEPSFMVKLGMCQSMRSFDQDQTADP